ncbi:MAG TPA: amidohydrolase family protein, partial [bacterium]|nr:amidohydrolase family protein [bacterium]
MFDLLIRKGTIYDGSGRKEAIRTTDIGITDGKIKVIGNLADAEAQEIIDASEKVVTPGFIDPHGHSDMSLLANPQAESLVRQGITAQISGQCGASPFPVTEKAKEEHAKDLKELDLDLTWSSMGGYRKAIEYRGIAINSGILVGHGTVRACVCGYDAIKPNESQMKEMVALVDREMSEGALGFSSGLQYSPGHYAEPWELIPLARAAAQKGGIYTTHMRSEGNRLFESIEESIMVAREAGITLEIAHLKSSGKPNWGKMDHALEMIEAAEKEGIDIAFDRYPYLAGSTSMSIYFSPAMLEGGREKMLERISDPKLRPEIRKHMDETVNRALG